MRIKVKMPTGTKVETPKPRREDKYDKKCRCIIPETEAQYNYGYCPYCGLVIK